MLPLGRHTLVALVAVPLALTACGPKEPDIDLGGFLDAFGGLADTFSDIQINDVPEFDISDAEADAGDVQDDTQDDVEVVEDVEIDTTPEPCAWQIVQSIEATSTERFLGLNLSATRSELAVSASGEGFASENVVIYRSRADGPWEFEERISPNDEVLAFGDDLLLQDDLLIVGASLEQWVYIYERGDNGFEQVARVDGAATAVDFGRALALLDDSLFIGAFRDETGGTRAGAVFEVQRQGGVWGETPTLALDGSANEGLGRALSISGDTLLVGGLERAWAYSVANLEGAPIGLPAEGDGFGDTVLATADTLYVGAWGNLNLGQRGSVVFFERNGDAWERGGVIVPEDNSSRLAFGYALAGGEDVLVVGASTPNDERGADQVVIFERNDEGAWAQSAVIPKPEGGGESAFGTSVAVVGDQVFVGDPYASVDSGGQGAVYNIACR